MKIVVVSHKECWEDKNSKSGYSTIGGFPYQMERISLMFDETKLVLPVYRTELPEGNIKLSGRNLTVCALDAPPFKGFKRKLALIFWSRKNLIKIWRLISSADAVHAPVPGDIGTLGILIALAQKKLLFVRQCGTWGNKTTLADRFLEWLLPKIADDSTNIVMATGGGNVPPCSKNMNIEWIFATSIDNEEWEKLSEFKSWKRGDTLKLISVSRLDKEKNTESAIKSLEIVIKKYPDTILNIVGDGPYMPNLKKIAAEMGVIDRVFFYGRMDHHGVMEILKKSNIMVFPTNVKEGFPKVVIEALSCGLPVIGSNVSVIPYLLGKGGGVVLRDTTPENVADSVLKLIEDDETLSMMAISARKNSKQYTLEKWQDKIERKLETAWGTLQRT